MTQRSDSPIGLKWSREFTSEGYPLDVDETFAPARADAKGSGPERIIAMLLGWYLNYQQAAARSHAAPTARDLFDMDVAYARAWRMHEGGTVDIVGGADTPDGTAQVAERRDKMTRFLHMLITLDM